MLLTGRDTRSGNRKNSYPRPDQVHKGRRISSIKDRVYDQKKAASYVEELIRRRVRLHFSGGYHCISEKKSCRSQPSNRIKPYLIVHARLSCVEDPITHSVSSAAFV